MGSAHHGIPMRTVLDIQDDVLEAARALATARGVSVGMALSELARRGLGARMPVTVRSGFPVFQVPPGTPAFGPDEVAVAIGQEASEVAWPAHVHKGAAHRWFAENAAFGWASGFGPDDGEPGSSLLGVGRGAGGRP